MPYVKGGELRKVFEQEHRFREKTIKFYAA